VSSAVRPWLAFASVLAVLPFLPWLDGSFGQSLLVQMGIAVVFALSYNMLLGQTGLLSFGHAVYFGLGAYVAIHFMRWINGGLPLPVALVPLVGGLGGLAFGIPFGWISTRRAGTVFAMISLGLGELAASLSLVLVGFFGGEGGISADRTKGPELLGMTLGPQIEVYLVAAVYVFAAAIAMRAFAATPLGRMCNAVRDNPERAEFVGYDPQVVRFIALAAAAFFAGIAGGLHAINYEIVSSESLGAGRSGAVLLMAFIGGIGLYYGPIIGAVLITILQVMLSDFTDAWLLYFGLFFVIVVLFAPGGLAGSIAVHGPLLRAGRLQRLAPAYALALMPALVMTAGAILLIEVNYRLSTKPELGSEMRILDIVFDARAPWVWLVGIGLLVGGGGLFRVASRLAGSRFDAELAALKGGAAS